MFLVVFSLVNTLCYGGQATCFNEAQNSGPIQVVRNDGVIPQDSLQDALDYIQKNGSESEQLTICLSEGNYTIEKPVNFSGLSLGMIGTGKPKIECNYNIDQNASRIFVRDADFTMHFFGSREISLEGLEFIGCPYPFRLIEAQNITVTNCIFR